MEGALEGIGESVNGAIFRISNAHEHRSHSPVGRASNIMWRCVVGGLSEEYLYQTGLPYPQIPMFEVAKRMFIINS